MTRSTSKGRSAEKTITSPTSFKVNHTCLPSTGKQDDRFGDDDGGSDRLGEVADEIVHDISSLPHPGSLTGQKCRVPARFRRVHLAQLLFTGPLVRRRKSTEIADILLE